MSQHDQMNQGGRWYDDDVETGRTESGRTESSQAQAPSADMLSTDLGPGASRDDISDEEIRLPDYGDGPRPPARSDVRGTSGTVMTGTVLTATSVLLLQDAGSLRRQWESVQVGFVDDPRQAVNEADTLVSEVIDELVKGFRVQRERLERGWSEGAEPATDELREAFQRYRDFFERLLRV